MLSNFRTWIVPRPCLSLVSVCAWVCVGCNCPLRLVENGWDQELLLLPAESIGRTEAQPQVQLQLQLLLQPQPQNSWNVYSNPEIKFHLEISYTKWASDLCVCVRLCASVAGQTCMFKLWNQRQRQRQRQQQLSPADWSYVSRTEINLLPNESSGNCWIYENLLRFLQRDFKWEKSSVKQGSKLVAPISMLHKINCPYMWLLYALPWPDMG